MSAIDRLRAQAEAVFARHGVPAPQLEHWKYTDIRRVVAPFIDHASPAASAEQGGVPNPLRDLDAYRVTFVDGRLVDGDTLPDGVRVRSLAAVLAEARGEEASRLLAVDERAPLFNGLVALNAARACDGLVIDVADGVCVQKPLYVLHWGAVGAAHPRHWIRLGRHAELTLIEHYLSDQEQAGLTNGVTRLELGAGAHARHVRLQQEARRRVHIGRLEARQARASSLVSHSIALGGAWSRVDIACTLADEAARCRLDGLYLLAGRQHADHHTEIEHGAPFGVSREMYRGVLDGRARAVFNGRIVVREGAVKTDSAQRNANLLLSDRAEVDTKPELEIYNDDVQCAHGATVGQLDAQQLFYLRARGLSEEQARQLLTFAFADEVLAGIKPPEVRRYVERAAFGKLPQAGDIASMLQQAGGAA